jgi:phage terminase large subunit
MTKTKQTEASRRIREWRADPLRFVRDNFGAVPDAWQEDALEILGRPGRKRLALKACAGPGKTAVLAWGRMASARMLCGTG